MYELQQIETAKQDHFKRQENQRFYIDHVVARIFRYFIRDSENKRDLWFFYLGDALSAHFVSYEVYQE